jgi:hypothetical protein
MLYCGNAGHAAIFMERQHPQKTGICTTMQPSYVFEKLLEIKVKMDIYKCPKKPNGGQLFFEK